MNTQYIMFSVDRRYSGYSEEKSLPAKEILDASVVHHNLRGHLAVPKNWSSSKKKHIL